MRRRPRKSRIRTAYNIATWGPTMRPSGTVKLALNEMGKELDINLTGPYGPTYRAGGLWRRGITVGRSAMINDYEDGGQSTVGVWIHESYHYFQQLTQGWARQFTNGIYEQWWLATFKGMNPYYEVPSSNEYRARVYEEEFMKRFRNN